VAIHRTGFLARSFVLNSGLQGQKKHMAAPGRGVRVFTLYGRMQPFRRSEQRFTIRPPGNHGTHPDSGFTPENP